MSVASACAELVDVDLRKTQQSTVSNQNDSVSNQISNQFNTDLIALDEFCEEVGLDCSMIALGL